MSMLLIKISRLVVSSLFVLIFFSPLYLPLFYEPQRTQWYMYELGVYVLSLFVLGLIFNKLDKATKNNGGN